jgi:molybdate transport system substrate-binding protein
MANPQPTINVLSTIALRSALKELIPAFTQTTGIEVSLDYGATAHLGERIRAGARGDLLLAVAGTIDALTKEDILNAGSRVDLVGSEVAMAVQQGASVPDISTHEAFIATLRSARSIAFSKQGASGVYFASLVKSLGLEDELRDKLIVLPEGLTGELVLRGEAELAVQQLSELKQVSGINIFAKLPPSVQQVTILSAGTFKESSADIHAQALIKFLRSDEAKRAFQQQGLDPL